MTAAATRRPPARRPGITEHVARAAVRGLVRLPSAVRQAIAGPPLVIDGQTLDLSTQMGIRLVHLFGGEPLERKRIGDARAQLDAEAWIFGDDGPLPSEQDVLLPAGDRAIAARIYRPTTDPRPLPGLVFFHGGGWVLGSLATAEAVARHLAGHAGIVVVSVDYRLAPEHVFPAGLDDADAAFTHIAGNAARYGMDPDRVAVGGESAGGNLAAVVALLAARRARRGPAAVPAFQLLLQPVTDLSTKRRSYAFFGEGLLLTQAHMDWYRDLYLPDPALVHDPRVSPLLADDLHDVAAAHVSLAGFDVLRDEGEAYALKLAGAGVAVSLHLTPSLAHSAVNSPRLCAAAADALDHAAAALRDALEPDRLPLAGHDEGRGPRS